MTYKLENAVSNLASRLVTGIIRGSNNLHSWQIKALIEEADDEAVKLAKAIRETIIAEIEARKIEDRK